MSKNPFEKYISATTRQNDNYNYLRVGTASLAGEYAEVKLKPQYNNKTLNDYVGDTAVDATKAAMTLAQTGISAIDAGAYAAEGLIGIARGIGSTVAPNYVAPPDIREYGQFSKLLDDGLGFSIGKAKQQLGELGYSDIRKAQEQELYTGYSQEQIDAFNNEWANQYSLQYQDLANKGANVLQLEGFKAKFNDDYKKAYTDFIGKNQTSWDKSLGENLDAIGTAFGKVADNPSLGFGAAIESTGYLLPSLAVSRGIAALQGAAKANATERAIAAGIGEGSVSALALNEQMRGNSETGTIDGNKVAAGFSGGGLTGVIGGVSNKLGSKFGLDDVDSIGLGTQGKGFSVTRPLLATGQEGAEEFVQGIGETVIPNIAEGKDPLQGLAQELALGTVAGGIMGGATNAKSLVSGAASDLMSGLQTVSKTIGKGKEAITAKTFEELNDPTNKAYDPAKAFNSQVPKLNSEDEAIRAKAQENIDNVFTSLDAHASNLIKQKAEAEGILKNIAALPVEEQAQHNQTKEQAEKAVKNLTQRIADTDNQFMSLMEQQVGLAKNQEIKQGIQYTDEQAKQDIETLSKTEESGTKKVTHDGLKPFNTESTEQVYWLTEDLNYKPVNVVSGVREGEEYTNLLGEIETSKFVTIEYADTETGKPIKEKVPLKHLYNGSLDTSENSTAQQEAAQRITKHFSKLSLDELDVVAKSPYLSEEQRNSLRYLSETKRAIANASDQDQVFNHIVNGLKGKTSLDSHRGLNTYTEIVNTAINTKDEKLLNIALDDLGRFSQDHTAKTNAVNEAFGLVNKGTYPLVQVLRTNDGTWGIETNKDKFLNQEQLAATGSLAIHKGSNSTAKKPTGFVTQLNTETKLIKNSYNALTNIGLSFGLGNNNNPASEVQDISAEPTQVVEVPSKDVNEKVTEPIQRSTDTAIQAEPNTPQSAKQGVLNKLTPKNLFTVTPRQGIPDTKAPTKASIATKFIGFGEGIKNSSTQMYAEQVGKKFANTGNYTPDDVVFVSVAGKRGNAQVRQAQQNKTIDEALKAIKAGAILITDNQAYTNNSNYNEGEKKLAKALKAKGYSYTEHTVNGELLGVWFNPNTPTIVPQTEPTEAVVTEPTKDTTQSVEAFVGQNNSFLGDNKGSTLKFDKAIKLKDVFDSLLSLTSNRFTAEERKYFDKLFSYILKVKSNALVYIVKDPALIKDSIIKSGINKGGWYDIGSEISYVYLEAAEWNTDTLDALSHELIHSITYNNLVTASQEVKDSLNALQQHLSNWLIQNYAQLSDTAQARLAYAAFHSNNEEMLSVTIGEASVQKELSLAFSETQLTKLRGIFKTLSITTQEQENERNQRRSTGDGQADTVTKVSSNAERSSGATSRNTTEDSGNEKTVGNRDTTASSETVPEPARSVQDNVVNQAEVENGKVTALQGVTEAEREKERSKLLGLRDMLKAYFTQSSTKEEGKGANPLVAIKDYILQSDLITQVSNWLSTGYKVSNAQLKQLQHFKDFHSEFREHILFTLQNRSKIKIDSNTDNFIEYLINKDAESLKDTLDENTLTAISLAAYSYLLQYGTKVTNIDKDIIKLLRLEKDTPIPDVTGNLLRNAGQDAFSVARDLGSSISNSLGLKAMKDASTAMQDRLNTAFGLLAVAALHNSDYMRISQLSKNDINAITKDLNLPLDVNDLFNSQDNSFVRLNQLTTIRANYKLNPETNKVAYRDGKAILVRGKDLEKLLAVNKDTKGFLSQLFGVSVGFRLSSIFIPEKFTQKSIPNTNASIPNNQRKQVEAAQKNSNVMRVNTVNVFKSLFGLSEDSKYLKELLGIWVDDKVLGQTHISKHESLKAKAENEWRLVNQGLEWAGYVELGNDEYAEFYDTQNVVQNNRMHIDSNLFNMQSSQIHRAMAAKSAFAVTFNIFENQELLTRFYQGVAEGLEKIERSIKQDILNSNPSYNFFTVDKVPAEDFVPAFEKFLSTPESIAAIDAMIVLIQTKSISDEQQASIAWFVAKGGMGVQSLQSLIFLAELGIAAQADGMLTTTVSYGSDGINNGVSNANMLLGTASETMRTQTGIISKNSTANSIQDVYAQGISDYYVDFGSYMRNYLESVKAEILTKIVENTAIDKRLGKEAKIKALLALFTTFQVEVKDALGMRKISKVWSIPFNYGAGKVALQRALANGFMKGIYDEMERINNSVIGKPKNSLEYATAIQDRNILQTRLNAVLSQFTPVNNKIVSFDPIVLPAPENLNTYTFQEKVKQTIGTKDAKGKMSYNSYTLTGTDATYAIELALKTAMIQLHGKAAWKATEAFSKQYMDMYSLYLKAQGTSFEMYNFIHSKLVQIKLDAKIKANKVEGEYIGLTTEELQEIDNIIGKFKPVVNTPISSQSTNAAESGIFLADKDKKLEKESANRQVSSRYFIKGFGDNQTPNMKPALVSNKLTDKGTAGMALPIQGMDALVASAVQAKYPILNIHDQASMPIDMANEIIQYQNEVHLNGLITYHLGLENAKTLVNTLKGVLAFINSDSKVLEDEKANVELLASLATEFKEKLEPKLAEGELVQNVKTGEESYRYKGLSLKYPDMSLGESTTNLSDAIKTFVITAISNDIKKLNALLDTKVIHQYGGEGGAIPVTNKHKQQIQEQIEYLQRQRVDLVETLNTPVTKDFTVAEEYKSSLLEALESTRGKPMSKEDVLDLLTKKTHHTNSAIVEQEQEVLNAIKNLIPDDLTLVYEEDTYEGQGYYNTKTKRIHIKATTSEGGYVDTHLLIHELLHSAVAARLEAIKANPNKYGEAKQAMDRLEALRLEILGNVGSNSPITKMLNNLDEFISYGLSNQKLQAYLKSVQLQKNKRSAPKPISEWRRFVEAVTKLISFRGNNGSNALTAFAVTTAELLEQLKGVVPANTNQILKSEYGSTDQVNQMSSIEVMQSLPYTGNTEFGLHLNSLAETVIGQLYSNDEVAKAQIDVVQALNTTPAMKAGFNLSQREAAVQQSLELVLETYLETNKGGLNVGQLWKLFAQAQKNIKVENFYAGDWNAANQQQKAEAKQKYDYVFNSNLKGADVLARFVSMGLAVEKVHNLFGFNTITAKPSNEKTWFDTFNAWLNYVVAWLSNKLVKTSSADPLNKQLQKLVNNLTELDIRNRQNVTAIYDKAWNLVGSVTRPLDKYASKLRDYAVQNKLLSNSKYLPLRALGAAASIDAKARNETLPKLIKDLRDSAKPNEKLGEAMTVLMESTAMTQIRKAMEALIRQANLNAKTRQDLTDNTKKAVMSWFKNNGKDLTQEQHKALTYLLLRADVQSLVSTYSLDKVISMLLDTQALSNEIKVLEAKILKEPNGNDMLNSAMQLGWYMVHNEARGEGLVKNATAIAIGLGTNYQISEENVNQNLVNDLDILVSLYAANNVSSKDKQIVKQLYQDNKEAIHKVVNLHYSFMESVSKEFKDNPLNYTKGWMPEITNPYREIQVAKNETQRDSLIKEGWELLSDLKQTNGTYLMMHKDIGYQRLVSGAVDLQNPYRKGTEIAGRTSKDYLQRVKSNLESATKRALIPYTQFDPSKQRTGLIVSYDTDGKPMSFNYEMGSWLRDTKLERNNNFADLLGAYAGSMFYKPTKKSQSAVVADVLFEDYKQNYQKNPNAYIKLSGKSSDPKIVEMWQMLPRDFKQKAASLYGKGEPIIINNEAFILAFGFKKMSVARLFDKPEEDRTKFENMFIHMAEGILRDNAQAKIAKAGHIWQEVVSKAKDFIVIRSISVLWYNVLANGLMLAVNGINPVTVLKDWVYATSNVRAYQKLNSELIQLQANRAAGNTDTDIELQIKRIEAQLKANPMSVYIEEGLLSSIVEDVTIQQGDYTYNSEFKKKIDNATGWIPDSVKTLASWSVLSPNTQAYQMLATTTQLSDFVAKYSLAKHLQSKGMDFKAAVSEASQTFINYDVPQGVGMQYANDMGLFMFTKFFLRIQTVLLKLMDKRAATVLAQHIATESLTDMHGILDPMALMRIGNNPFELGAFALPSAFMSIATVDTLL